MVFIRKIKKKSGTYLAEVEGYRENGKVKQRVIRYLGKEIDGVPVKKVYSNSISIKSVKRSLDIMVIKKMIDELSLNELVSKEILSLVISQILERKKIYNLVEWFKNTEIVEILKLDNLSTKSLYSELKRLDELDFEFIEEILCSFFSSLEKENDVAIIDVTDTYFEGNSLEIKRRKGKDGKVKKLIQFGLAVSKNNGFPICSNIYQGNLSDIQIFKDMSLKVKKMNYSSIIVDRGMISFDNIKLILKEKLKIIAGIKYNQKINNEFLKKINREEIFSKENQVKLKSTKVYIKTFDYHEGKLIAVYSPEIEVAQKEKSFEQEKINDKTFGYSLIYHNTKYNSDEAVKFYYEKDIVEKAFKNLKGVLQLRPIRFWLTEHIRSHFKICYLAYSILIYMNFLLKNSEHSVIDVLNSLQYGYKIKLYDEDNNHEWDLLVPLEPKQKIMLKKLNCCV